MISTLQPSSLWIGNVQWPEFRAAVRELQARSKMVICPSISHALEYLEDDPDLVPRLIVLATERPGMLTREDTARLADRLPSSASVQLLGSWCEGEIRSGRPLPGLQRIYWHQWASPLSPLGAADLGDAGSTECLPGALLPDGTSDTCAERPIGDDPLVLIRAGDAGTARMLEEACLHLGYTPCQWRSEQPALLPARAIVWDLARWEYAPQTIFAEWQRLGARYASALRIAVVAFPRWDEVAALRQAGVSAILAKPFALGDLQAVLLDQPATRSPLTN